MDNPIAQGQEIKRTHIALLIFLLITYVKKDINITIGTNTFVNLSVKLVSGDYFTS